MVTRQYLKELFDKLIEEYKKTGRVRMKYSNFDNTIDKIFKEIDFDELFKEIFSNFPTYNGTENSTTKQETKFEGTDSGVKESTESKEINSDEFKRLAVIYSALIDKFFTHHSSGEKYILKCITNTDSKDLIKFPITVVYGINEQLWSRPLVDFHKKFTLVK